MYRDKTIIGIRQKFIATVKNPFLFQSFISPIKCVQGTWITHLAHNMYNSQFTIMVRKQVYYFHPFFRANQQQSTKLQQKIVIKHVLFLGEALLLQLLHPGRGDRAESHQGGEQ